MSNQSARPPIESVKSAAVLSQWYWLKSELVGFARTLGVAHNCSKPELLSRLCHWLETGEKPVAGKPRATSLLDWRKASLNRQTVITDSYKNSQNMRRFMQREAAEHFAFSNEFMAWMKAAQGKTLQDAIDFWRELDAKKKHEGYREKSLPQNQYNQFSRDISASVAGISATEIRRIWAIKRSLPGPHVYQKGDEDL